jgi:hypothetical protein
MVESLQESSFLPSAVLFGWRIMPLVELFYSDHAVGVNRNRTLDCPKCALAK